MGNNPIEILLKIFADPIYVINNFDFNMYKINYVLVIFGLLLFFPLFSPSALLIAIPIIAISLLSNLKNYYDYASHYTTGLIAPFIYSFKFGVESFYLNYLKKFIGKEIFLALVFLLILIGHSAFSSSPISRLFWSEKVRSYSWRSYIPTDREKMIKESILKYIPADKNISVSTQNSLNWHHLAHRDVYLVFPQGVVEPYKIMSFSNRDFTGFINYILGAELPLTNYYEIYVDYVVLDLKRPWFIVDKGCDWIYGSCQNQIISSEFLSYFELTKSHYDIIFEYDGFFIFKLKNDV